MIIIKSDPEVDLMRQAGRITAGARTVARQMVEPGVTTRQINREVHKFITKSGASPCFMTDGGFPTAACISVNDEVVHGIGRHDRFILKGDVVSVDVGIAFEGGIGDTARTVYVGNEEDMPEDVARLLEYTQKSLEAGLAAAHPGGYVQDISRAVEEVAQQAHLGIVREYVGHGCGIRLHEPPDVPNFAQHRKGPKLVPGMVLCVEPMLNLGSHKVYTESDGWTVRTRDGEPSAHFEHMILITENGTEVLTRV